MLLFIFIQFMSILLGVAKVRKVFEIINSFGKKSFYNYKNNIMGLFSVIFTV